MLLAGLLVGRTPEYLGRKIEARAVTLSVLAFLSMPVGILLGAAISSTVPQMLASVQEAGPHGPLFVTLLVLTVLILGALTFFPVLALGPIAESTALAAGQTF